MLPTTRPAGTFRSHYIASASSDAVPTEPLTRAETRIVALVAKGLTDKQIEDVASLSIGTIRGHIGSAFRKTNTENRVQLALAFLGVKA